ncbi:SUMF1/EgtB/PvdO family nonheme iron enzyme [bacterium]|nr:SUMF1/EgtB/PvdO family nonheme iron enzyme [bacterium]
MKTVFLLLLLLLSIDVFADFETKGRVVIKIDSDVILSSDVKKIVKLGFEEIATQNGFGIVDEEVSRVVYEQILKDSKWEQNDPKFLQKFGKQLSANFMVIIKIVPQNSYYHISNRWIDLKTGVILKTKTLFSQSKIEYNQNEFYGKIQTLAKSFIETKKESPIIIEIESSKEFDNSILEVIKLGFEEIATKNSFIIVDESVKKTAFEKIKSEHNWKQNDPKFLPELGKQLSAKEMVLIKIVKKGKNYLFSNQLISLESGAILDTKTLEYNPKDDKDFSNLFLKVQKLAQNFLCKTCVEKSVAFIENNQKGFCKDRKITFGVSQVLTERGFIISSEKNGDIDYRFFIECSDSSIGLSVFNREEKIIKTVIVDKVDNENFFSKSQELGLSYFGEGVKTIKNSFGMVFSEIPAGIFYMGSNSENATDIEKKNYKRVEIRESFYMGQFEITQEQFEKIMGVNPSYFKNCLKCPVENITYQDVIDFIEKLNSIDKNYQYRLPSETEWEYASKAGSETPFYFGESSDLAGDYSWYKGNSNNKTGKVGEKKCNKWRLCDTIGNVMEMTSTIEKSFSRSFDPKVGKITTKEISYIILKGGSFMGSGDSLKTTISAKIPRNEITIGNKLLSNKSGTIGFRLILMKKK